MSELWALRGVSFDMPAGQSLGVIGPNGAGKSTLLKIISRITPPTEGRVRLRGRVGSLLEVGTGFHPELTGRENIYLNAAILGMTRSDVRCRFDEIVDFAEISRFLDTPVKRYSSGMYVRLAFAVAAHLEPDILVVDEVLSVGDHQFQKKCLGKMTDVANAGRTVLFVSHNMAAVSTLCTRAILLGEGGLQADGPARSVVRKYVDELSSEAAERSWTSPDEAPGGRSIRLKAVRAYSGRNGTQDVDITDDVIVEMESWCLQPDTQYKVSFHVKDEMGVVAFVTGTEWECDRPGIYLSKCTIPGNLLNDGRYALRAYVIRDTTIIEGSADDVISFVTYDSGASRGSYVGHMMGVVRPKMSWTTTRVD